MPNSDSHQQEMQHYTQEGCNNPQPISQSTQRAISKPSGLFRGAPQGHVWPCNYAVLVSHPPPLLILPIRPNTNEQDLCGESIQTAT